MHTDPHLPRVLVPCRCAPGADVRLVGAADPVEAYRCLDCGREWSEGPAARAWRWWGNLDPLARAVLISAVWLVLAVALSMLAGCATRTVYVDRPVVEYVDRRIYVPIERALCAEQPIATGPVSAAPQVANDRKLALERANANARAVCAVQGTPVE